jgi:hypothetical protein
VEEVEVPSTEGEPVKSTDGVPSGSVATGGRVFTAGWVGVAAVEQAVKARTNTSRTPKIFGYFIFSPFDTSKVDSARRASPNTIRTRSKNVMNLA